MKILSIFYFVGFLFLISSCSSDEKREPVKVKKTFEWPEGAEKVEKPPLDEDPKEEPLKEVSEDELVEATKKAEKPTEPEDRSLLLEGDKSVEVLSLENVSTDPLDEVVTVQEKVVKEVPPKKEEEKVIPINKEMSLTQTIIAGMDSEAIKKKISEEKIDVNKADSEEDGYTPLIWAVRKNSLETMKALIESGADVNKGDNKTGKTPLMWAAIESKETEKLSAILENKASLDAKDKTGRTALHYAGIYGKNPDVVQFLISKGADKDIKDLAGKTFSDYLQENKFLRGTPLTPLSL